MIRVDNPNIITTILNNAQLISEYHDYPIDALHIIPGKETTYLEGDVWIDITENDEEIYGFTGNVYSINTELLVAILDAAGVIIK